MSRQLFALICLCVPADLNGDKRPDLVAGAEIGANEVRWWRNEGSK